MICYSILEVILAKCTFWVTCHIHNLQVFDKGSNNRLFCPLRLNIVWIGIRTFFCIILSQKKRCRSTHRSQKEFFMSQDVLPSTSTAVSQGDEHSHGGMLLGPLLCWAVVFADIGTSVYYVPGILYGTVGNLAGFFVFLTMTVFVLLTLKYAEVTNRFPQGGGVVTVAAQAMNHWVGALGGMFILVDYFLTDAISY